MALPETAIDVALRVFRRIMERKRDITEGRQIDNDLFQYAAGMVAGAREVLIELRKAEGLPPYDFKPIVIKPKGD
jgi:hypothetical protein